MNALLIYMVKTAVYLAGFYLIYFIFLSRDTKYLRNRAFILLSVLSAFLLPLISVNVKESSGIYYFGKSLSEVLVTADGGNGYLFSSLFYSISITSLVITVYFIGVIVLSIKLLIDLSNLFFLITRKKKPDDHIIYFNGFNTSGFSAMGYIFINRGLTGSDAEAIIRHEQNHLDNNHFFDILFIEIALVFQWFNPFIYLINRSLRAIHEYQADQGCLKSGMPVIRYQSVLLNNVLKSGKPKIYNSFSNPSMIRKRMTMMVKEPTGNSSSLKILLVIPVIAMFLLVISACEKSILASGSTAEKTVKETKSLTTIDIIQGPVYKKPNPVENVLAPPPPPPPGQKSITMTENIKNEVVSFEKTNLNSKSEEVPVEVFVVVEEMPQYPGGDKTLMSYINENIVYPERAKANSIQGRVILRFAVMATGKIDQVSVLKKVDPDLDQEAKRVIESLPDWTPGKQGGKPVNVWYSVPVTFQLK
jgi:TonB family protein